MLRSGIILTKSNRVRNNQRAATVRFITDRTSPCDVTRWFENYHSDPILALTIFVFLVPEMTKFVHG